MTARDLIDKLSGPTQAARELNAPLSTMKSWSSETREPPEWIIERLNELIDLRREKDCPCDD